MESADIKKEFPLDAFERDTHRVYAFLIDLSISNVLVIAILAIFWKFNKFLNAYKLLLLIEASGFCIYSYIMSAWKGQTVGKALLGLLIIDEDYLETTHFQLLLREVIGKMLFFLFFFVTIPFLMTNKYRRGIHDYLSKTFVIDEKAVYGTYLAKQSDFYKIITAASAVFTILTIIIAARAIYLKIIAQ